MKNNEWQFEVEWCNLCGGTFVRCPKCGNNSCNATYGRMDKNGKPVPFGQEGWQDAQWCDVCPLAYQYQELYWEMEKFCTCPKECTCELVRNEGNMIIDRKDDSNCPFHGKEKRPVNPNCPLHGKGNEK